MDKLDAMALAAEEIDKAVEAGEPGAVLAQQAEAEQVAQGGEKTAQIGMILALALPLLGAMYPSLPGIYTEQAREAIAQSLGPLMTKYNISLSDWGSAYKEEIGALMVCGPIAWATVNGIKADIAAREKQAPKELVKPTEKPAQATPAGYPEIVSLG